MNEEKLTDLILKISTELAVLNQQTKSVLDTLTKHEQRIGDLERSRISLRDTTIQWLVKGLIASIAVIGSMTGAGAILSKILGL